MGLALPLRRRRPLSGCDGGVAPAVTETAGDGRTTLKPVHPRRQPQRRVVDGRKQHPRTHQLEQQPRSRGPPHLGEPRRHDVGGAHQLGLAEPRRLGDQPLGLVLGSVDQPGGRGVGDRGDDHQVAQPAQDVLGEPARVLAGLDDLVDHPEDTGAVDRRERVDHLVEQVVGGVAEQVGGDVVRHAVGAGATQQLVEDGEGVTRRPGAGADHEGQRGGVDLDALLLAQPGEVVRERARRDQPERVVVRPRADGRDDLLGLGGGEDELQVLGRLLDQLEQGVEALRADHVRLVDDVDLEPAAHRREERPLAQVTSVVDTTVAGRVDLDHVDRAGASTSQVAAGLALAARVGDGRLLAVQRARQDPGAGRLAAPAGTGEQVGVVDPVVRERCPQRLGDVVLPDHLGERLRPVAAVEGEGGFHG